MSIPIIVFGEGCIVPGMTFTTTQAADDNHQKRDHVMTGCYLYLSVYMRSALHVSAEFISSYVNPCKRLVTTQ